MKHLILFFLIFTCSLATAAEGIDFLEDFKKAQKKAKKSNQVLFVNFTAKWCGACKMMEKSTYRNDRLIKVIRENAVPMKLDIETFDGIELKMKYNVAVLPTVMFFYPDGSVAGKFERILGPSEMEDLIKKYNRHIENKKTNKAPDAPTMRETEDAKAQFIGQTYKIVFLQTRSYSSAAKQYYEFQELYNVPLNLFENREKNVFSIVTGDYPSKEIAEEAMRKLKGRKAKVFVSAMSDL